jgi:hypothetical protein
MAEGLGRFISFLLHLPVTMNLAHLGPFDDLGLELWAANWGSLAGIEGRQCLPCSIPIHAMGVSTVVEELPDQSMRLRSQSAPSPSNRASFLIVLYV